MKLVTADSPTDTKVGIVLLYMWLVGTVLIIHDRVYGRVDEYIRIIYIILTMT